MAGHAHTTAGDGSVGGSNSTGVCSGGTVCCCHNVAAGDCSNNASDSLCASRSVDDVGNNAGARDNRRCVDGVQSRICVLHGSPARDTNDSSGSNSSRRDGSRRSPADVDVGCRRPVRGNALGSTGEAARSDNAGSNPGRWAAVSSATWRKLARHALLLGALAILLLGTLNQIVGKIRAKALGRFDSVVAICNAFLYTIIYFSMMRVLLWTKHIDWENISFIWSTVDVNTATSRAEVAPAAASPAGVLRGGHTEDRQAHGLCAPLLRQEHVRSCRQQQQPGATATTYPGSSAAAGEGGRGGGGGGSRGAWRWLLVTGCCDACGNILGFLAQPYVPGPYFVMALQAIVPCSCLCSMLLLKRRYTLYHVLALVLVIAGVLLPIGRLAPHAAVTFASLSETARMIAQTQAGASLPKDIAAMAHHTLAGLPAIDYSASYERNTTAGVVTDYGKAEDDKMGPASPVDPSISPASSGAFGSLFLQPGTTRPTGDRALHQPCIVALRRAREDAATQHEEAAAGAWGSTAADSGAARAGRITGVDSVPWLRAPAAVPPGIPPVGCVNCFRNDNEDSPVGASGGAAVSPKERSPATHENGGSAAASGASGALQNTNTNIRQSKPCNSRRQLQMEAEEPKLSSTFPGVFMTNSMHNYTPAASNRGGQGMRPSEEESAHTQDVEETPATIGEYIQAETKRQSRHEEGATEKQGSADAGPHARSETAANDMHAPGKTYPPPVLLSAVPEITRSEGSRMKGQPFGLALGKKQGSKIAVPAPKLAGPLAAAEGTDSAPRGTAALTAVSFEDWGAEPQGIAMWIYLCLAALSTLPTALSFTIKERLMRQYEQLYAAHSSSAALPVGSFPADAGALERGRVEVRALGVATLVASSYSSATDVDTPQEERNGESRGSSRPDVIHQTRSRSFLSEAHNSPQHHRSDYSASGAAPAPAAVADAKQAERSARVGQKGCWTSRDGDMYTTSNSSSQRTKGSSGSTLHAVHSQIVDDASSAATDREPPCGDAGGEYIEGSPLADTRTSLEVMAAECSTEGEGAEVTVSMGSGMALSPQEALEDSRKTRASNFAHRAAFSAAVSPSDGPLTSTRRQKERLHVIVVCAYGSAFQLLWAVAALPLGSWLGQTDNQSVTDFAAGALGCFAGASDVKRRKWNSPMRSAHPRDVGDTDLCPYALRAYAAYIVINVLFNISLIGFTRAASSVLTFVTLKATLPLGIIFYALFPWPLLETADAVVDKSVIVRHLLRGLPGPNSFRRCVVPLRDATVSTAFPERSCDWQSAMLLAFEAACTAPLFPPGCTLCPASSSAVLVVGIWIVASAWLRAANSRLMKPEAWERCLSLD